VDRTVLTVERLNPHAIVYQTVNCSTGAPIPDVSGGERPVSRHDHHFNFDTLSLKLGDDMDIAAISSFFHDMSTGRYGDIVRAKALVNTLQGPYKFDLTFANIQSVPFEKAVTGSRLVIIGKGLNKEALSSVI
jgi:G3E family GTPase